MIKVALISHSASFAGAERMLYQLAKLLKESHEYYPIIFLPTNKIVHSFTDMCYAAKIEVQNYPDCKYYIYNTTGTLNANADYAWETLNSATQLNCMMRKQGIGLIVCNTMTSLAPMLAARETEIPSVLWVHGILDSFYISSSYDSTRRLILDRLLMAMSNQVICCSEWTEDYYRPLSSAPIRRVMNWSEDVNEQCPYRSDGPFVCLNTFDPHKGVLTLLHAAKILKEKQLVFRIELYGTGEEEEMLRAFVKEHKLTKEIIFCGRTNDVTEVYHRCCALLQPCYLEPFGLTITEAMSCSRPVVAVNSGGPSKIVLDGETGFLVEPRDAQAMAGKMEYILTHPEQAERMGQAGRERYEVLYSPQRARREFMELFYQVLNRKREWTPKDQLLKDVLQEWLREESMGCKQVSTQVGTEFRSFLPEQLSFSGPLKMLMYGKEASNRKQ